MPPARSLSQQLADVAVGLVTGIVRIWRAGAQAVPDARADDQDRGRTPRRHESHGTLLSSDELRAYLDRLYLERLEAHATGVFSSDAAYTVDLDDEIAECRLALVGARVIDIARQRAEAVGRQTG